MKVVEVLHMNGGVGDKSYSNNSLVQRKVISMTKPIMEQAIMDVYCTATATATATATTNGTNSWLKTLNMADLGCSSGPNTLFVASDMIKTIDKIRSKLGHSHSLEIQICLNDLPGNDFNTIFRSLPKLHQKLDKTMGSFFFTAVPGSFYGRLFPSQSLHFVHSSYSLQWLSQVPDMEETNKGNIYMSITSPASVIKAYYEQFQRDFTVFLKCRAEEMVEGGRMVLTFLGRRSDDPRSKECCYIWQLLAMALNDMVSEGLVEESKVDSFDIPQYTPSPTELREEIKKEGSFTIDRLEVSQVNWDACMDANASLKLDGSSGYNVAKYMRAVAEPMLESRFGQAIMDQVFDRYAKIIDDRMSKEKTEFINVTVSMTR